jgi:hypothetical protein
MSGTSSAVTNNLLIPFSIWETSKLAAERSESAEAQKYELPHSSHFQLCNEEHRNVSAKNYSF